VANGAITKLLDAKGLNHTECVMYRTVNNDFTPEEIKSFDYDMALFFSPSGIKALKENFPKITSNDIKIGTFGPSTAQAVRDAKLNLDLEAPTERYPSMTGALRHFLQEQEDL
jgi:uroporphyrinogen-III synthase